MSRANSTFSFASVGRRCVGAAYLLTLVSCSLIDTHKRVEGWPILRLVEHYVPDSVMKERCAKYVPFGFMPEACAEFYFAQGECHVWYSADYPPTHYVMQHERLHCQGYDHVGSTNLRDVLNSAK